MLTSTATSSSKPSAVNGDEYVTIEEIVDENAPVDKPQQSKSTTSSPSKAMPKTVQVDVSDLSSGSSDDDDSDSSSSEEEDRRRKGAYEKDPAFSK